MFPEFHFNLNQILTVSFTLFAVIDILGAIPILIGLKERLGEIHVEKATIASGFLMILFLFVGQSFLGFLGVTIGSFAIAGSIVIFLVGLEMVLGVEFFKEDPGTPSGSIVPVAFPLIAGSGTLTSLISLKASFDTENILIGIILNLIVIYITLLSLNWIEKMLGKAGLLVVRKFFGVILLAIAVKIFKEHLHEF
jgi:multiple antibiotic resistance protein